MDDWKSVIGTDPVPWLMEGDPWTRYLVLQELRGKDENDPEIAAVRVELNEHPGVVELKEKALDWFSRNYTRHNDPKLPHYYLSALADLGVKAGDSGMDQITAKAMEHWDGGLPAIRQSLPVKGKADPPADAEEWHALPCDAPVLIHSLLKMGVNDERLDRSLEQIRQRWDNDEPWFCNFFFVESMFKKTGADCPMAGLMALKAMTVKQEQGESGAAAKAFASLKAHRDVGRSLYYFGRSKKFYTLKFPFVWYNAFYMAHTLADYPQYHHTTLYRELLTWILESQAEPGRWKATSVYRPYKEWDFGQKKNSSRWISALCCSVLIKSRLNGTDVLS